MAFGIQIGTGSPLGARGLGIQWFAAVLLACLLAPAAFSAVSINNGNLQPAVEGIAYQQQINASGSNLAYSLTGNPTWLSINSNTGLISGTPPAGATAASPYSVTVAIFDLTNPADQASRTYALSVSASGGSGTPPTTGSGACALYASGGGMAVWLVGLGLIALLALALRRSAA
jgi:hypothetical protein